VRIRTGGASRPALSTPVPTGIPSPEGGPARSVAEQGVPIRSRAFLVGGRSGRLGGLPPATRRCMRAPLSGRPGSRAADGPLGRDRPRTPGASGPGPASSLGGALPSAAVVVCTGDRIQGNRGRSGVVRRTRLRSRRMRPCLASRIVDADPSRGAGPAPTRSPVPAGWLPVGQLPNHDRTAFVPEFCSSIVECQASAAVR